MFSKSILSISYQEIAINKPTKLIVVISDKLIKSQNLKQNQLPIDEKTKISRLKNFTIFQQFSAQHIENTPKAHKVHKAGKTEKQQESSQKEQKLQKAQWATVMENLGRGMSKRPKRGMPICAGNQKNANRGFVSVEKIHLLLAT